MEPASSKPRTVNEVFADYKGRRAGFINALTKEVDKFRELCDPERENLCLYAHPNQFWEVIMPADEIPPELPEPALGINFARDGMHLNDWLSLIAVHSDSWLLSVAFFFGARFGFEQKERQRLFDMINELPTVFEVVTKANKKRDNEKSSVTNHRDNNSRPRVSNPKEDEPESANNNSNHVENEEGDVQDSDNEEDDSNTFCGICQAKYSSDEFWICCDVCEEWFHGKCVKISPAKAEYIKQYKCPNCSLVERSRNG